MENSGALYSLRLLEYPSSPVQDYVLFQPYSTCQAIDVSPDGILWCLDFNGDLYEFDKLDVKWRRQFNVGKHGGPTTVYSLAVTMTTLEWLDTNNDLHSYIRSNGMVLLYKHCCD